MKTKLTIVLTLLFLAINCMAGTSPIVTNAPTDQGTVAGYDTSLMRWQTVKNLQDSAGKILILPYPRSTGYTTTYATTWIGNTQRFIVTNVCISSYDPTGFDTTTWPYADPYGIAYNIAVITNPLIAKTSNFWINSTGTAAGWQLVQ